MNNKFCIDKLYYINLERRSDRHLAMIDLLKSVNMLDIGERIEAVDGSNLDMSKKNKDIQIFSQYAIDSINNKHQIYGITLTKGGAGCALSHRKVWNMIRYTPNIHTALILEDDVTIEDKKLFKQQIHNTIIDAPRDFDILFIGYHPASIKYIEHANNKEAKYFKSAKTYGLFGYVVTKKGADKLLKINQIDYQIDTEIARCTKKYGLKTYLVRPSDRIIHSEPSETSTSGTDIQLNHIEGFVSNSAFHNVFYDVTHVIVIVCMALLFVLVVRTIVDPSTAEP